MSQRLERAFSNAHASLISQHPSRRLNDLDPDAPLEHLGAAQPAGADRGVERPGTDDGGGAAPVCRLDGQTQ